MLSSVSPLEISSWIDRFMERLKAPDFYPVQALFFVSHWENTLVTTRAFSRRVAAERKRRAESLAKPANTAEKAVGN